MGSLAQSFQRASLTEMEEFSRLVGLVCDNNPGVSALDLSADFNSFLRDKDPRGLLHTDFMEFVHINGYRTEPVTMLAYAA